MKLICLSNFGCWLRIMFYNSRKAGVLLYHIYNTNLVSHLSNSDHLHVYIKLLPFRSSFVVVQLPLTIFSKFFTQLLPFFV